MARVTGVRTPPSPASAPSASRGARVEGGEAPTASPATPQAAPASSPWVAGGRTSSPAPREHAGPDAAPAPRVTGGEAPTSAPPRSEPKGLFRSFFARLFGGQ